MTDKRTGKKKKKVRPVVTDDSGSSTPQETVNAPKKTKKSSKV